MILSAPQVVRLAVDHHENLIQMPLPLQPGPKTRSPLVADLGSEHRAEPLPPETNGFLAHADATLV